MKQQITLMIAMIFLLSIIPFASAGTLISGNTMEVRSNYPGIDGLTLVGTWSTTPTVNDRVFVNNLVVPEPYSVQGSKYIEFSRPTFEQVFEVRNQRRAYTIQYEDRSFNFALIGSGTALDRCIDKWEEYRETVESNKELMPGFEPVLVNLRSLVGSCRVFWATMTHEGWYGDVFDDRIFYQQTVSIEGVSQNIVLERSDERDQLVGTIPGVARAALLDFGMYTNARLSDNNVKAFHGRNNLGSDNWKPFSGSQTNSFEQAVTAVLDHREQVFSTRWEGSFSSWVTEFERLSGIANNRALSINSASQSIPTQWQGNIANPPRTSGNTIIVEPRRDTFTANIQVAVKGDSFGLFVPTGVCEIVSADQTVQWAEGEEGYLNYRLRNTGTDTGSMRVTATCDGGNIQGFPEQFALSAGQTVNQRMTLTGQSVNFDPLQSFSCEFSCRESNTGQTDTHSFTAIIERKEICSQGEELAPVIINDNFVVDVLDSDCNVIQRKTCPVATGQFVRSGNVYSCEERTGIGSGDRPFDPDGEQTSFNPTVLIIALILGLIAGTLVFVWTAALPKAVPRKSQLRGWLQALRVVLAVVAFVVVMFLVAVIVRGVIAAFSFPSLF